jgi:hypothetical protein
VPLIDQPTGNYRFLPGIAPYSCGVVSSPGYEIVHITLGRPVAYQAGFEVISQVLAAEQRPQAALCAIELRSPRPYSFQGFADFNAGYAAILESWGLFVDGVNPVARTNVAPVVDAPREPILHGFSFTKACSVGQPATFVVAGAGELPEGVLSQADIVALGDPSAEGLATKAGFVMDLMENRLRGLGVGWPQVNTVNVYTAHSLTPLLEDILLKRMGSASKHGVRWHYSRPPIEDIEYEMDLRGIRTDLSLDHVTPGCRE